MNHERVYLKVLREIQLLRVGTRLRSGERIHPANDASKRKFRPAHSQPFLSMNTCHFCQKDFPSMIPGVALHGWWYCSQACLDEIQAEAAAHPPMNYHNCGQADTAPPSAFMKLRPVKQAEALGKPFGLPTCIECHEVFDRTSSAQRFCPKCYEKMQERTTARPTGQTRGTYAETKYAELLIENATMRALLQNGLAWMITYQSYNDIGEHGPLARDIGRFREFLKNQP